MPSEVTMLGVVPVTRPMKPIGTPFIQRIATGGRAGMPESLSRARSEAVFVQPRASSACFSAPCAGRLKTTFAPR